MPDKRRIERLEHLILETVAPLISHGLSDPRLAMVTVTRVRLSPDLSLARVNWSTIGDTAARSKAAHALDDARGYLTASVARSMRTRTTPRLEFHYDESIEKATRVSAILAELARERAEREAADAPAAAEGDPGAQAGDRSDGSVPEPGPE